MTANLKQRYGHRVDEFKWMEIIGVKPLNDFLINKNKLYDIR